jgi:hypothetical protein
MTEDTPTAQIIYLQMAHTEYYRKSTANIKPDLVKWRVSGKKAEVSGRTSEGQARMLTTAPLLSVECIELYLHVPYSFSYWSQIYLFILSLSKFLEVENFSIRL